MVMKMLFENLGPQSLGTSCHFGHGHGTTFQDAWEVGASLTGEMVLVAGE